MPRPTLRLGLSAHYTSHVWFKHGLSYAYLTTFAGRIAHLVLAPLNALFKLRGNANIDTFLLQRHQVINQQMQHLIDHHGVTQILELASGLSPRGLLTAQAYPEVDYIESDVPQMVAHKTELLKKGAKPDNLSLAPCFFMAQGEQVSIQQRLADCCLDKPTLIISEGLLNYFSTAQLEQEFKQIAQTLKSFKQGFYITDLYTDNRQHRYYAYARFAQRIVGMLTGTNWQMLYQSDEQITQAFLQSGFAKTQVINPQHTDIVTDKSLEPFVRIILAQVH